MLEDKMSDLEGILIAVGLIMSVVLGLVILWVARNLRKEPADPQGKVAAATRVSQEPPVH